MRKALLFAGLLGLTTLHAPLHAQSSPWAFGPGLIVSDQGNATYFHHLASSGRRNIAVSEDTVAIAWKDNRDGIPRVYVAGKTLDDAAFSRALRVSGESEAYEPTLVALDGRRFALAWEEEGRVHVRVLSAKGFGPTLTLPAQAAMQPSLLHSDNQLLLVVAQAERRFSRIYLHRFAVEGNRLSAQDGCPVEPERAKAAQLYPTLAQQQGMTLVAWEDRRPGHTIIMTSEAKTAGPDEEMGCDFSPPKRISLRPERAQALPYGRGHGVARVALAAFGTDAVMAVWEDKRNFREGYDIYSAKWLPERGFGANLRVQDAFSGVARQWDAAVAGDRAAQLVAAWADEREGHADVMYSWWQDGAWSDDVALSPASGPGEQRHPTVTLDTEGNLHAAWIERETVGGPTRLRYALGKARSAP